MSMTIYHVDAFTDRPFAGNPAGVCVLPAPREDTWMQDVAQEMNLSETAFLVPVADGYHLRWFTPTVEVDLCGHATLASAHVLWETDALQPDDPAVFHTKSGRLTARRSEGRIVMDFPTERAEESALPDLLRDALSLETAPVFVGRNRLDYLVVLSSEEAVRGLAPDMDRLVQLEARGARPGARGVIVTASDDTGGYDFISRYFAPAFGIPEDPVTGSAHCCLGPYWQQRLGKDALVGYQASARGGTVHVRPDGDRVLLGGQAVTVLKAELVAGG